MWRGRRSSIWVSRLLFATLAVALGGGAQAQDDGPRAPIERLNDALLETMRQADELGYAGRYQKLEPVLEEVFDFPFMTRLTVGPAWREMSEAEQQRLVELFEAMSVATFAARFDGYGGERFEITGGAEGPRGSLLVESRIVPADEPAVELNYLLHEADGGWRVIDVLLDARFSELARQRSEFAAVLREGGYDALVRTLEDKIEQLGRE